jgi:hypothetical protein
MSFFFRIVGAFLAKIKIAFIADPAAVHNANVRRCFHKVVGDIFFALLTELFAFGFPSFERKHSLPLT